jgi:hypothetical protein
MAALTATTAGAQVDQNQGQQTTLAVTVAVERSQITAGPYARYAQKYLGVAAPLADKVLYEVTSVKLLNNSAVQDPVNYAMAVVDDANASQPTHMKPAEGFPRLTVDKISNMPVSLEESARLAAEKIFELRRGRLDLISGEIGENVFGGGLGSALKEIARLEEEYLSLFFGLQTASSEVKQYSVTPSKGRLNYTVCRFSETDGLLPQDDLSGVPVVLELIPAADAPVSPPTPQGKPSSRAVPQIIPAVMKGRIILEGVELASDQFTIRQLGETVWVNP